MIVRVWKQRSAWKGERRDKLEKDERCLDRNRDCMAADHVGSDFRRSDAGAGAMKGGGEK